MDNVIHLAKTWMKYIYIDQYFYFNSNKLMYKIFGARRRGTCQYKDAVLPAYGFPS